MFVSFEGIGGAGKTTQAELLRAFLESFGRTTELTREPGGTPVGEAIRKLLLENGDLGPHAEALLFAAARAELVDEIIEPALARGALVISDRYVDSSLAYQGIVRGVGVETVLSLNHFATRGRLPDVTFFLNVDAAAAAARRKGVDRIEGEDLEMKAALNDAYLELAARFKNRIVVLDADRETHVVSEVVREHVRPLL